MPTTPNYGWTLPDVGGSSGAWGGQLNALLTEADADIAALSLAVDTRLDNIEAELSTNISVSGSISAGTTLSATGTISTAGTIVAVGGMSADSIGTNAPGLPNGVLNQVANFAGGTDGALGPLGFGVRLFPSAVSANRFVQLVAGDTAGLRTAQIRAQRLFVGTNTSPAFVGSEQLSVEGETALLSGGRNLRFGPGAVDACYMELFPRTAAPTVRGGYFGFGSPGGTLLDVVNDIGTVRLASTGGTLTVGGGAVTVSGAVFSGSGANLTSIPQSGVVNLVSDLSGKSNVGHGHAQSEISGLVAALAAKSDAGHTHDASAIISGSMPFARITNALPRLDFVGGESQAFSFVSSQFDTGSATVPALGNIAPGAFAVYEWTWVEVQGPNTGQYWMPVLRGFNI